jgi:DNA-binding winged helix-turn-helix (wHTH) protein
MLAAATLRARNERSSRHLGSSTLLYAFENFFLDTARRELSRDGALIATQPQVFDVLQYLICNREHVVSKDDLIASVWGGRIVSESTLSTRINAARTAIEDSGEEQRLIRTVSRKGIRFIGVVHEESDEDARVRGFEAIDPPPSGPAPNHGRRTGRRLVIAASVAAMLVFAMAACGRGEAKIRPAQPRAYRWLFCPLRASRTIQTKNTSPTASPRI